MLILLLAFPTRIIKFSSFDPAAALSFPTTPTMCTGQPAAVCIAVDSKHPMLLPNLLPASLQCLQCTATHRHLHRSCIPAGITLTMPARMWLERAQFTAIQHRTLATGVKPPILRTNPQVMWPVQHHMCNLKTHHWTSIPHQTLLLR